MRPREMQRVRAVEASRPACPNTLEESSMAIVSLTRYLRGRRSDDRFTPPRVGPLGERLIPPGEQRFTRFQDMDPTTARVASGQQEARKVVQPWDQPQL